MQQFLIRESLLVFFLIFLIVFLFDSIDVTDVTENSSSDDSSSSSNNSSSYSRSAIGCSATLIVKDYPQRESE